VACATGVPDRDASVTKQKMNKQKPDPLGEVFRALGDQTRRAILIRLIAGEATVSELAEPFQLTQPTISKHLKVLEDVGLIEGARHEQKRPRHLVPGALEQIDSWLDPFRQQWELRFHRLETHLSKRKRSGTPKKEQ
jgi:DNA-binding transcriptional ArsR family regulator